VAPDLLVGRQPPVGVADDLAGALGGVGQQHRVDRLAAGSLDPDDAALLHQRVPVEHALDVFRIDVATVGQHDLEGLAPRDVQEAVGVEEADVAGAEPAVRERPGVQLRVVQVAGVTVGPRIRISRSSAILTSTPGIGFPTVPSRLVVRLLNVAAALVSVRP
jgi:hypothetical protein